MRKQLLICFLLFTLMGCATTRQKESLPEFKDQPIKPKRIPTCIEDQNSFMSLANQSYLQQGKRYFEDGYYKKSMMLFLPLACDGNAEAQYAVGYMYYNGYGVTQDTEVGYFWIRRSANQGYSPAISALTLIEKNRAVTDKLRKHALAIDSPE